MKNSPDSSEIAILQKTHEISQFNMFSQIFVSFTFKGIPLLLYLIPLS